MPKVLSSFLDTLRITVKDLGNPSLQSRISLNYFRKKSYLQAIERRKRLSEIADSLKCSEMKIARNLVAIATIDELADLQILLEFWKQKSPLEPRDELENLLDALPLDETSNPVQRWLLSLGVAPKLEDLAVFCKGSPRFLIILEHHLSNNRTRLSSNRTSKLFKSLFKTEPRYFESATSRDITIEGFKKGLPLLGKEAFEKLPNICRRWILNDQDLVSIGLTSEFAEEIRSKPLSFADSPEAIESRDWLERGLLKACTALSRRSFETPEVHSLLERTDLVDFAPEVLKALGQNREPAYQSQPQKLFLRRPLSSIQPIRLRRALRFFSLPPEKRLSTTTSLSRDEIEQLVEDVSLVDWVLAIRKSESKASLQRLSKHISSTSLVQEKLFKFLPDKETSKQCLDAYTSLYIEVLDYESISRLFESNPSQLKVLKPYNLGQPKIQEFIRCNCSKVDGFVSLAGHAPPSFLRALFSSRESWIRDWREKIAWLAYNSGNCNLRRSFLAKALRYKPALITSFFQWQISNSDFDFLLRGCLSKQLSQYQKNLLRFVDSEGIHWWEKLVQQEGKYDTFRSLVISFRPALSARLESLHAEYLMSNESFCDLLRKVLQGEEPFRKIRGSQGFLRHFIPWVQKEWADKPTLSVAFEIALAFSPHNANYILALCTHRWKDSPRDKRGKVFDHLYKVHSLPKKSGGKRNITVPDDRLKRLQRMLLREGFEKVFVHPSAHGFTRGRSILSNAKVHVGQPVVVNVDIQSFFPNTGYEQILKASSYLMDGKISEAAKHVIADICSFEGGLPTGAPTSPAIANLVMRSADSAIAKVAKANGINYTRYADDLTFSGDSRAIQILPFVKRVLGQLGYQLDPKKTNIFRRGRRQIVTGLVVNQKPNLPRRIRRRLRAAVHRESNGEISHWHGKPMSRDELLGRLAMLNLVQPGEVKAMKQKLAAFSAP